MKEKIIIPRKDHEVYFIRIPEDIKSNKIQSYVYDKLSELHPGSSASICVDIKKLTFKKIRWFMVTVIEAEKLTEYQIIHKGAILYTNTSIFANSDKFVSDGLKTIDDELIGFDSEKNMPVSLPLDSVNTSSRQIHANRNKHIPYGCYVFNYKKPNWLIAAIPVGITLIILLTIAYISKKIPEQKNTQVIIEPNFEQSSETASTPPAFAILANIAELILNSKGEIERWQYHDGTSSGVIMECKDISALTANTIFNEIEYMTLRDIQNVNYIEGKPAVTIILNTKTDIYSLPVSMTFFEQNTIFNAAHELTAFLSSQKNTIISETFPSSNNGFELYSINYTANGNSLVTSMSIIEKICEKHSMFIKGLEIKIGSDRKTFTVTCAFAYNAEFSNYYVVPDEEKKIIPLAFGYRPVINYTSVVTEEPREEKMTIIGRIKDTGNEHIYYYDGEGKIRIRSDR